ncbi:hypothetical protein CK203_057360 [Vitis vinifera]|uniref:Uncharacterized protein n=1 Tax=Vitis vinifera TaxID=29760 RepID=A0A438GM17_VITVI|nr:hypothetical protein CK203_057360 [Vitis vinifera]
MIGEKVVEKALLDLGASVNLLPYSIYKQLGLVDNFYYPVDFIVLDTDPTIKEANLVPIILGRSFLATSNAIINCRNGLMQLTFGNMTLDLNIFYMSKKQTTPEEEEGPEECALLTLCHQEKCLMEVLKRCKKAIGWQISDLKGISPLVCTHHIYMEEEAKPIRQLQRRLNPHLQEVVRAEVLKLLQAGIIYPISDSPWVSLLKWRNFKRNEGKSFGAKTEQKQSKNRAKTGVCEISQHLRNRHFTAKPVRSLRPLSAKIFLAAKPSLAHECHFAAQEPPFHSCETAANHQSMKDSIFAGKAPFAKDFTTAKPLLAHECPFAAQEPPFRSCETVAKLQSVKIPNFAAKAPFRKESIASNSARFGFETEKLWPFEDDCANHERKYRTSIFLLLDTFLKQFLELKLCIPYLVSKLGKSEVQRFKRRDAIWKGVSQLRNHFWHTSAILQHSSPHFKAAIQLRNHL